MSTVLGTPGSVATQAPPAQAATATPERLPAAQAPPTVWDLPLRLFHLALLLSVGTALATAWMGGNAMVWHGRAGAVVAGLLGFRLAWGVLGARPASSSQSEHPLASAGTATP